MILRRLCRDILLKSWQGFNVTIAWVTMTRYKVSEWSYLQCIGSLGCTRSIDLVGRIFIYIVRISLGVFTSIVCLVMMFSPDHVSIRWLLSICFYLWLHFIEKIGTVHLFYCILETENSHMFTLDHERGKDVVSYNRNIFFLFLFFFKK